MNHPVDTLRANEAGAPGSPRWYEIVLGVVLIAVLVAIAITLVVRLGSTGEAPAQEWRDSGRAVGFLVVMLAGGGVALLAFLVAMLRRNAMRRADHRRVAVTAGKAHAPGATEADVDAEASGTARAMPVGGRLVGLLLLPIALLLLAWLALPSVEQRALITTLVYPAAFAVALVLLFDKASRAWHYKGAAEGFREWLLCDLLLITLVLGFLNALRPGPDFEYASVFFDVLHVVLFFGVFLLLDRGHGRYRFLVAYGYLLLLPFLLWAWRAASAVAVPEDIAWTATIWPFVVLGVVYFVLEIIALLASRGHSAAAAKDVIALLVYAGFLIAALPSEG